MRLGAVLFTLLVLPLAASCGGREDATGNGEELRLPVHEEWEAGMAALVGGIVEFDEATKCVFLVGDGYRTLIVWPPDTRATRDPLTVVLADGRQIHEGDYVEGSGGGYAVDPDPPERCVAAADSVDAFNWHDDLVVSQSGEAPVHPAPQAMVPFAADAAQMTGMTDVIEGTSGSRSRRAARCSNRTASARQSSGLGKRRESSILSA